jgi:Lamin Tail Domain
MNRGITMKSIPALSLALALIVLLPGTTFGNVVINEVELNPPGDENGHKAPVRAWVELYNDDKDANIGGWSVNTSEGRSLTFPKGTIIRGLDYYIIFGEPQWLGYEEILILKNETGSEVDRTPALSDTRNDELAWTRDPDGRDTDSTDDWKFLPSSSGF